MLGESYPRFRIDAGGVLQWGSGVASPDVTLYRSAPDTLYTPDVFIIYSKYLAFTGGIPENPAIHTLAGGDTNTRCILKRNGDFSIGSGAAPVDCLLSRRAADIFNTPDRFEVGTLGVANSYTANTLGNIVKAMEIFDAAGNSLGKVPIYDAITQV